MTSKTLIIVLIVSTIAYAKNIPVSSIGHDRDQQDTNGLDPARSDSSQTDKSQPDLVGLDQTQPDSQEFELARLILKDIDQTQAELRKVEQVHSDPTEIDQAQPDSNELELAQLISKDINQTRTELSELEQARPDSVEDSAGPENEPKLGSRCLTCLSKIIPIPIPVNNGIANGALNPNNLVTATQVLADGRTALYNSQGQIIGFLPAGTTVVNNG